jgi:hypothetical protein
VGGTACRAHGGAAEQVRRAAALRVAQADLQRAFADAYRRYLAEPARWRGRRIAVAAQLLGVPAGEVNEPLIAWCRLQHGRPAPWHTRPTITTGRRRPRPVGHDRVAALLAGHGLDAAAHYGRRCGPVPPQRHTARWAREGGPSAWS